MIVRKSTTTANNMRHKVRDGGDSAWDQPMWREADDLLQKMVDLLKVTYP